ncbi:TetR family transcriptional regulator [Amycolatopsis mediterranei S699]|uniref:TetR family transcriptional regulator n=2 Tax=Amycolatopsis mediterranei TaxID=33910 RepID=A0A0H3D998_AMYMU|nr:TetR/AcrR family transcriptional regulator [Amycolatopsis mediterranei]ADJ47585.1 TetR family transcriptional regulator [Amycolatopsis mediterranei U32]AEK44468.1 TetR family transcriptional regulator [Amycolatopsis mediterranei S699]AFO79297.1 TetR family transcriptional regulator [Amycolatopsis mediterranei S699]AGT86425.1 TetR family transcriptional regulator [Amycolatopsis mediterranei RB]KDO11245.1 TetR family transcriptional regulator [Amycolatopsis mediterranei]
MTGGYLKGRIRREDIITAAAAAYGELGYHGSSLREIAKRVGISHAGLLYYFPTKEALLAAVLERRDAEDSEREQLTVPPGLAVLRHFVALAEHNVRHPGIVDLYSRLAAEAVAADHPAHEYFVHHYRAARDGVYESFEALAARGELRDGVEPAMAALTFIALMDGLQVQWLTVPGDVDLVGSLRFYLQNLLTVPL